MPLLKHQLTLHPDTVGPLALDKPVTPYERRVGLSYLLRQCRVIHDADDALDELNETPLQLHGRTFTPTEALEGLLWELAERYRHYIETTPWWKVWWHAKLDRQPWMEADWRP